MQNRSLPTAANDVVPVLAASDVARTLKQYRDIGFTARISSDYQYGFLRLGDARFHVSIRGVDGADAPPSTCLIYVDDPDALAAAMREAGHGTVDGPADRDWGLREGIYTDPDDNIMRFGRRLPGVYL